MFKKGHTVNRGRVPWNKGKKHRRVYGEKNPNWKGDNVSYRGLHLWVESKLGKPKHCAICQNTDERKVYHWANVSKTYKRDLSDWIRLCVSCHSLFDRGVVSL